MSKAPEDFDARFWELCIHVLNLFVATHLTILQACDVHGHILLAQAADLYCSTTSNHPAGSQCLQYICKRAADYRQPAGGSDDCDIDKHIGSPPSLTTQPKPEH